MKREESRSMSTSTIVALRQEGILRNTIYGVRAIDDGDVHAI